MASATDRDRAARHNRAAARLTADLHAEEQRLAEAEQADQQRVRDQAAQRKAHLKASSAALTAAASAAEQVADAESRLSSARTTLAVQIAAAAQLAGTDRVSRVLDLAPAAIRTASKDAPTDRVTAAVTEFTSAAQRHRTRARGQSTRTRRRSGDPAIPEPREPAAHPTHGPATNAGT